MSEFANTIRRQAEEALWRISHQQAALGMEPLLQWVMFLLADDTGSVLSPPDCEVTDDQWFTWNLLAMDREQELVAEMLGLLEAENMPLPLELKAARSWANSVVLGTLDRMGML
jgi:hypothetical protein